MWENESREAIPAGYGLAAAQVIAAETGEGVKAANAVAAKGDSRSRRAPVALGVSGAGAHLNPPLVNAASGIPRHVPPFRTIRRHALQDWLSGAVERRDYALALLFELSGLGPEMQVVSCAVRYGVRVGSRSH